VFGDCAVGAAPSRRDDPRVSSAQRADGHGFAAGRTARGSIAQGLGGSPLGGRVAVVADVGRRTGAFDDDDVDGGLEPRQPATVRQGPFGDEPPERNP
jgi:hypothetical protein